MAAVSMWESTLHAFRRGLRVNFFFAVFFPFSPSSSSSLSSISMIGGLQCRIAEV